MSNYIVVHSVRVATEFVPETFGRLTTIGPKFTLRPDKRRWFQVCVCECGTYFVARCDSVVSGRIASCGCLQKETASIQGKRNTKHGKRHLPEYYIWQSMTQRCSNPNIESYHCYGGRGIRVCGRWLESDGQGFLNFLSDMGERPSKDLSIDRHPNPDGNYEPGNCRWATDKEQCRNRRSNTLWTHNGKTQCIAAWAEEVGISQFILSKRLRRGWSVEKALQTPPRSPKQKTH